MRLRQLKEKDAPYMLEWMKDSKVNCFFRFNADDISLNSTINFINNCKNDKNSFHFAIVDDRDEYLGTVSIKNIDMIALNGEYAIALRYKSQGLGVGRFATNEILKFAFTKLKLERVYLNVLSDNEHAISFYEKSGFIYEGEFYKHIKIRNELKNLKWYRMMRSEYDNR